MPDAIMETDVLQTVNEFAQAGGNITHALQRVTDSYIGTRTACTAHSTRPRPRAGYAHMARLVCQWLEETPATEGSDEAPTSSSSVNEATFLRVRVVGVYGAPPVSTPHLQRCSTSGATPNHTGVHQRPL